MLDRQLSLHVEGQIKEAPRDDHQLARFRRGVRVDQRKASGFGGFLLQVMGLSNQFSFSYLIAILLFKFPRISR